MMISSQRIGDRKLPACYKLSHRGADHPSFSRLVEAWAQARGLGQGDAREFFPLLTGLIQGRLMRQGWEKRVHAEGAVTRADCNPNDHALITLKFPSAGPYADTDFPTLIRDWQDVDGMTTALLRKPILLSLCSDRGHQPSEHAPVVKLRTHVTFPEEIWMTGFHQQWPLTLGVDHWAFKVVACIAHLGENTIDHYQTATLDWCTAPPTWYVADDNQPPVQHAILPQSFYTDSVQWWLCRADRLFRQPTVTPTALDMLSLIQDASVRDR